MSEQRIDLEQAAMIFGRACEMDGEARRVYLDGACDGDAPLRAEIQSMIEAHGEQGEFLSEPTNEAISNRTGTFDTGPLAERVGAKIGRYKLLQQIGEGGFGVVYMAEQQEPVRRKVALKIIKLGMDTKQVIARFEAERQALAIMEHSNIARVLDAGATETGRPFFVMDLVKGIPITDYCDQANLTTKERLDLFMLVCHAIQHAHQKGIIHRDVKPSNVMITLRDGKPVPKVIDFGIAKATDHRLTEKTLFTEYHQFVGTPAYMSPEQAEMSELDVDTRTDVYSLGVLMYELLTGTTPFELTALREAGFSEIQRIIREVDPPIPSSRLSSMGAADLVLAAQRRKVEGSSLSKLLRGDLDWIVMRALEKDRTRRYETARELALDVERHLANEPILANPPRVIYKVRKFVKRNRVAATAGLAVSAALVVGLMLSTAGFVQAGRQRDRAEVAHAAEATQRKAAVSERDQAIQARQEARRQSYVANVIAAGASQSANEIASVRRRLAAAPEEFRNWEWRHLHAQADRSLAVLQKHKSTVGSLTFSPDGTRTAMAFDDGTIRLCDASTGEEQAVLRGHQKGVISVVFSPVGDRLAATSDDSTARIWNVDTGQELAVLRGHENSVYSAAFSPDGTRLATAAEDKTLRIWNASTGEEIAVLLGHGSDVECVAFSPNGTHLASASGDRTLRLWDATTYEQLAVLRGHEKGLISVAFSPDGTRLASAAMDRSVRLWEVHSGRELVVMRGHTDFVWSVAFAHDGTRLVSGSKDKTIRIWNAFTGESLAVLRGHEDNVFSVVFNPDGTRLASVSSDGTVRFWDASYSRDDFHVLRGHDSRVQSVAFNPDGTRLASGSGKWWNKDGDNTVRVWDLATGKGLAILRGHEDAVITVAFSPDGGSLASASVDSTVRVWDASTGRHLANLEHGDPVVSVAYSPDSRRLASGSTDAVVRIWDASSFKEIVTLRGHEGAVSLIAFSPDGKQIASGSDDETVRLWDTSSGEELRVLRGHESRVQSVAFSPDGTRLASASGRGSRYWTNAENSIRLWGVTTGVELAVLRGHEDTVWDVAFSVDGTRLASTSSDGTVRIWDTFTGEEVATLRGHEGSVLPVAFSPDGIRLATGGVDNTVRIWDAAPYRDGYEERKAILTAQPEAEAIVNVLWQKLNDWNAVAERLRADTSLSDPVRRAALNFVLGRATGHS